jgi:hypothetical protein
MRIPLRQLVPLMLTQRFGANVLTNGTFDTDTTGWTTINSPTTFTVVNGMARITANGSGKGFLQAVTLVNGATYRLSYRYSVAVGTGFTVAKNGMASQGAHTGTGSHSFTFIDAGGNIARNLLIQSAGTGDHDFTVDDIRLQRVS